MDNDEEAQSGNIFESAFVVQLQRRVGELEERIERLEKEEAERGGKKKRRKASEIDRVFTVSLGLT